MEINKRMQRIREYLKMKQAAVAKKLGVTQQAYCYMENHTPNPGYNTLVSFCEVTGISMSFLTSDLPINEKNVTEYGTKTFRELLNIP